MTVVDASVPEQAETDHHQLVDVAGFLLAQSVKTRRSSISCAFFENAHPRSSYRGVMATITYESVLRDAQQLMPDEQRCLLEALTTFVLNAKATATHDAEPPRPKRSLLGIAADLGPGPSAEEIDEARREAWANFPRDDI